MTLRLCDINAENDDGLYDETDGSTFGPPQSQSDYTWAWAVCMALLIRVRRLNPLTDRPLH